MWRDKREPVYRFMEFRVLGCHGGESPKHRSSSFLIDGRLAVDAGAVTSMLSLQEQKQVRSVLVSHPHMDHVRDLASLADNRCQQDGEPIEIVATKSTIDTLKRHFFNDRLWPDFSKIQTSHGPTVRFRDIALEKTAKVCGYDITPVAVTHSVDTSAFLIHGSAGTIAYSGDTGPTERFWEVVNTCEDLKALVVEVSFPNEHHRLALDSLHLTPETLAKELEKLQQPKQLPVFLFHIKPVFEAAVERQLTDIKTRDLSILRLNDRLQF